MNNEKLILEALQFIIEGQTSKYDDDTVSHRDGLRLLRRIGETLNPTKSESYSKDLPQEEICKCGHNKNSHFRNYIKHKNNSCNK